MIVTNRDLMQGMTEAFLKGDIAIVQDYWDENIVWHFPGQSIEGEYHVGRE